MVPRSPRASGARRPARAARAMGLVAVLLAGAGGCGAPTSTADVVPGLADGERPASQRSPGPGGTVPGALGPTASVIGPATPPVADGDPGAGVAVEIRQGRASWGDRVVQVRVLNAAAAPVTVTSAELTVPTVRGTARSAPDWERSVPAGGRRDASVPLGPPVCPEPPPGAPEPGPALEARVRLTLRADDGRTAEVTRVAADPQGHLARIHAEDCAALAVARGLRVRPDPELVVADRDGELVATVELVLVPVAGGPPVTVDRVDGTVLIAPLGGASWPLPDAGVPVAAVTRVPLTFRAGRCDAHAVAEDKRGTYLGLHTTVDGTPQPVTWVWLGDDLSGQVHDFIGAACGWPSG